ELDRRRPGQSALTTQRQEADRAEILSGIFDGVTLGTPIAILVRNTDARSRDYEALKDVFRPGHADYVYAEKYGVRDRRGGGVVEVVACGVPLGWGDPTMAKLDALLGAAMLSIPATKGVEIGSGFAMCARRGSETNDVFDGVQFLTNHAGGIAGGISNGAEVV